MKRWIFLSMLWAVQLNAQQIKQLTLQQAYELAQKNYPLIKQKDVVKQTADINISNLQKNFLPQVALSGQASYQSDVTKIDAVIPGFSFDSPSKDQYKILADVNQVVFDGGLTKQQKNAQLLNAQVEQEKIEVELYKVKDRINQLYLSILFLDEQLKQVDLIKGDLQTGIKQVEAQVKNGVVLRSNLNVLKAESLKADQRILEIKFSRSGLVKTLGLFLNQLLDDQIILEKPSEAAVTTVDITRPEIRLFDFESRYIAQQSKLLEARNLPRAGVFFQGGYGKPGLNLLKNDFGFYYITGLRLNWGLGGLYTQKKEKQLVRINQKIIDIQKETFVLNTNTQAAQQTSEIEKLRSLLAADNAIIDLRAEVTRAAKAQLENGVINANDYLREINAEDQARQTMIFHQLQLLQAVINYQTTLGKQ